MIRAIRQLALPVSVGLALVLSSCGEQDTHGKILADTLTLLEELADSLEKAAEKEGARSAPEQVLRLVEEFEEIADRSDAVGKPSADTKKALSEKYGERRTRVLARLEAASKRARTPGDNRLITSLQRLGEVWSSLP